MCLMDWRLGRHVRAISSTLISNGLGIAVLPANRQRVGVTFWADENLGSVIPIPNNGGQNPSPPAAPGVAIPTHLMLTTHGDLVMQSINVQCSAQTPSVVYITEYLMTEEALAKADKYLEREGFA